MLPHYNSPTFQHFTPSLSPLTKQTPLSSQTQLNSLSTMDKFFNDDNINDPSTTSFPPPYVSEPKGYALSGKIMLSAIIILFAVVIIMVCLHIYARWYILRTRRRNIRRARRRTHLVFYIDPNDPTNIASSQTRGLDASLLKSLPTFVYGKDMNSKLGDNGEDDEEVVLECAVCLCEFEDGEEVRMLPKCNHCFHVECIDMWFHSHATCPLCRAPVEAIDLIKKSDEVVVELTREQLADAAESRREVGPSLCSGGPSASFGERRKGLDLVGVTVEVPRRCQSFSFTNSDESGPSLSPGHGFKSPTSRILSLKRILSREKRSPLLSPSGTSRAELDVESGRVDPVTTPSQSLTPR